MKKYFYQIAALVMLMLVGVSCEEGNDNWRVITAVQQGTYIAGDATIYSAVASSAQLKAADLDGAPEGTEVYGIYTWLKSSGSFCILQVDSEGNETRLGKGTAVSGATSGETYSLSAGADEFKVSADGVYNLVYNKADQQLTIVPVQFGVIGDATAGQWNDEVNATSATFDENQFTADFVMEGVTFEKKSMKFRYAHNWGLEIPYQGGTVKFHSNMGGANAGNLTEALSECKGGGENFSVTKAGVYTVTLRLDLRTAKFSAKGVCTAEAAPTAELPAKMFINGGKWSTDWDWAYAPEMTPVHSHDGMFWGIYYFEAGSEFKFNHERSWDSGDNFGAADGGEKEMGEVAVGSSNVKVKNAGYYLVLVTCSLSADKSEVVKKIELMEPTIYLIGNTSSAGWETKDEGKFTLTDDLFVSPALVADDNVRMCVKFDGCEWWQSEFNVFEGKIEFRGKGGDQAAVPGKTGQKVYLNFKDYTGEIK